LFSTATASKTFHGIPRVPNRNQRIGGIGENWGAHIGT
jgi:hypothetical protein